MKYLIVQAYWYFDSVTGEFHYRIQEPSDALNQDPDFQVVNIHCFHPLYPQLVLSADLLILHLMPDAEVARILRLRKAAGKPTFFEIADNFLEPGPWVAPGDALRNPEVRQHLFYYAAQCEGLQVSTVEVGEVFKRLNPKVHVFENAVGHFHDGAPDCPPLVIGWGGSVGHREDLAVIAPVIIDFCRDNDDVRFVYMGHPPIYEELFSELGDKGQVIPSAPVESYYEFLASIHVGLAPLRDTPFNRCRSDVKFIEYAAHRVVPVLSDATPYRMHSKHGENALIYHSTKELRRILEELRRSPEWLNEMGKKAYHYAHTCRDRKTLIGKRVDTYTKAISDVSSAVEMPELPDCQGLIAYMRQATYYYDQGRYTEANTVLDKVLNLYSGYQLAHLFKAKTLVAMGRLEEALAAYLQFEPATIYADMHYETLATAARELGSDAWIDLKGEIEDPLMRLRLEHAVSPSLELAQQILSLNPYDYVSLKTVVQSTASDESNVQMAKEILGLLET